MGESRGGEGRDAVPTTDQVARYFVNEAKRYGRELQEVRVSFVTKGLYAVHQDFRGENDPEAFFLAVEDPGPETSSPPHSVGSDTDAGGAA